MACRRAPDSYRQNASLLYLAQRIGGRAAEGKVVQLTPETAEVVAGGLRTAAALIVSESDMQYTVDKWRPTGLDQVIAKSGNYDVGLAAFERAALLMPDADVTLRQRARVIRRTKED